MELITIHKFSKLIGKTPQTLRNWDKSGLLKPSYVGKSGFRYYTKGQINQVFGIKEVVPKIIIGYCRVSSNKQKDDLIRQVENMQTYLNAGGQPYEIISDIGSGINYNNKGLQQLIERINNDEVSKVVVLYKDRLLRFGFELVQRIASLHGCEIEIITSEDKSKQQELVEDLIQIITVFSCRLYGQRANSAKKLIQELINAESD